MPGAPIRSHRHRGGPGTSSGLLFAAVYDRLTRRLECEVLAPRRAQLLGELRGDVLDIGAGTGANLAHLASATRVVAAEPSAAMRRRLAHRLHQARAPVRIDNARAEALPYPDASFDAVIFTCVLCSVDDPDRALGEARRVLKREGRLVLLEHVRGSGRLAVWQDRVTPLWSRIAGGCHPNRDIAEAAARAGFALQPRESFDPFPRLVPTRPMLAAVAVAAPNRKG